MPCYYPLTAWYGRAVNLNSGKRLVVFKKRLRDKRFEPLQLACGQCIGCRLDRARDWAVRCVHEAQLHQENCFITLTYNDKFLPPGGDLRKRDWQLFMKRLRRETGAKIRFYMCGEYGEQYGRPHYHACLFGYDFPDKELFPGFKPGKFAVYVSPLLTKLWSDPKTGESFGYSSVGGVTYDSAAYVARYILKKINGANEEDYYQGHEREFTLMSRGGKGGHGIGYGWLQKFGSDVYPSGQVLLPNGIKCRSPKYYDSKFDLTNPALSCILKAERRLKVNPLDNTPERLSVRAKFAKNKLNLKKRRYENEKRFI